jgi:hypothetical protein
MQIALMTYTCFWVQDWVCFSVVVSLSAILLPSRKISARGDTAAEWGVHPGCHSCEYLKSATYEVRDEALKRGFPQRHGFSRKARTPLRYTEILSAM